MRSVVVCVALAGCLSTTSSVATPAAPVPFEIDGNCIAALRRYPDATRCQSDTHVTGLGIALTVVGALALVIPLVAFAVAAPNPQ